MKKRYVVLLSALITLGIFAFINGPSSSDEPPNYGFVPNMGEASVSKVNLVSNVAVARYYTAPRLGQVIDSVMATVFGVSPGAFPVAPADWRTTRIAMDSKGNAWVLNTGADCFINGSPKYGFGIQGTVVRIQGDTTALDPTKTSQSHNDILNFGTDKAVEVYAVGGPDDIPRTIIFDHNGFLWIGFHMAAKKYGYFQKYEYDECAKTLTAKGAPVTSSQYDIAPYNCAIDKNGIIWFVSYGSSRVGRTIGPYGADHGMYSFNTNDASPVITKYAMQNWPGPFPTGTAYGVLVDNSPPGSQVKIYATSLEAEAYLWLFDSAIGGSFAQIPILSPQQYPGLRSLNFDKYGRLWIAGSNDNRVHWYSPSLSTSGYSGILGNTPVGVGIDNAGDMWVIVRDSDKLVTFTPSSSEPTIGFSDFINVPVGPQPYAYGDFTQVPVYYQICGYKYKAGTNPKLGLEGWTINLYKKAGDTFPATPTATTVTDINGHYCFTNLVAGIYKVTETLKDGWHQVSPVDGMHIITLPDTDPCKPVIHSYDFENVQTVVCFDETAWAANEGPGTIRFVNKGDWGTYAIYTFGSGSSNAPKEFKIFAGQKYFVGNLLVYDEGGFLYLKYAIEPAGDPQQTYKPGYCPAPGWQMSEYHFQVVDEFSGFSPYLTKSGNAVPGRFTNNGQNIGNGWFKIAITGYQNSNAYIAAHSVVLWCGYYCQ